MSTLNMKVTEPLEAIRHVILKKTGYIFWILRAYLFYRQFAYVCS